MSAETISKLLEHGLAIFLVLVGILMFTGAVASPITKTHDQVNDLATEIRKLVRIQTVMCHSTSDPLKCSLALIDDMPKQVKP